MFSGHRDMLHDAERNALYARAIEAAVCEQRQRQEERPDGCEPQPAGVTAVDIGAGSGLLGCFAARAGAQVTAFEVVPALARLARRVAADNALTVDVQNAHSTTTEASCSTWAGKPRACLMTHELLDSGLHAEGLLPAVRHAWRHLLKPGALSVPSSVELFVQAVRCPYVSDAAQLNAAARTLRPPTSVVACPGGPGYLELHAWPLLHGRPLGPDPGSPAEDAMGSASTAVVGNGAAHCVPLSAAVSAMQLDLSREPPEGVQLCTVHLPPLAGCDGAVPCASGVLEAPTRLDSTRLDSTRLDSVC